MPWYQGISSHSVDNIFIILDQYDTFLINNIRK